MPTYDESAITDVALADEKPVTFQMLRAFRDNLLASFEVSSGAPKLARKTLVGQSVGGVPVVFSGIDEFSGLRFHFVHEAITASTAATSYIEFSDNGSTWYGVTQIALSTGISSISGYGVVDFDAATIAAVSGYSTGAGLFLNGTVTGLTSAVTHVRFTTTTHAECGVIVHPDGGDSVI